MINQECIHSRLTEDLTMPKKITNDSRTKLVSFRTTERMYTFLKSYADKNDVSIDKLLSIMVEDYEEQLK